MAQHGLATSSNENAQALAQQLSPIHQIISFIFEQGKTLMEALGFTTEQLEFVYEYGLGLYDSQQYEEAKQVFFMLRQLNEKDARFPFAYASCCSQQQLLETAVQYYSLSALLDGQNPAVWFNMGDCYLQMKQYKLSHVMLQEAMEKCGVQPEFSTLKQDAEKLSEIAQHHLQAAKS